MKPVLSVAEMQKADASAPVAVEVLVKRAGWAVAVAARQVLGGTYGRRVVVVAGKGNNGADGRVAATVLAARGARVSVIGPGDLVGDADLVIDAAYGTGFRGSYQAPDPRAARVLAVDIPSGVNGDTGEAGEGAVRADATVTMAALKPGLLLGAGRGLAGRVSVADIGLPVGGPKAHLVEDGDVSWLPPRPPDSHKWRAAVWVLAGSPGMEGAAGLASRSAQRAGAGMIHRGSPGLAAGEHPPGEAVSVGLPSTGFATVVVGELARFKALVLGPGLGRSDGVGAEVRALVSAASTPTVIDADGLYALGDTGLAAAVIRARPPGAAPVVLTPHDGEFARLAGAPPGEDRVAAARSMAASCGAVVLLKGSTTVVAAPDGRVLFAAAGDARLATAGTGDVLSGVIGAFLAAGVPPLEAAGLGAHVHGRAARSGYDFGLVAGDLPDLVARFLSGERQGPGVS